MSFRNLWKGDRIRKETQKYGLSKMKTARAKRTWKGHEIETVSRINWTDSKIIATWAWEKEIRDGRTNSKMTKSNGVGLKRKRKESLREIY